MFEFDTIRMNEGKFSGRFSMFDAPKRSSIKCLHHETGGMPETEERATHFRYYETRTSGILTIVSKVRYDYPTLVGSWSRATMTAVTDNSCS